MFAAHRGNADMVRALLAVPGIDIALENEVSYSICDMCLFSLSTVFMFSCVRELKSLCVMCIIGRRYSV